MFANQNNYTVDTNFNQEQQQFIMPGAAVQPTYQVVNPFAGNHNYQPVPVVYDPSVYGVQYDAVPMQPATQVQQVVYQDPQPQNFGMVNNKVSPYDGNDTNRILT